MHDTASKIGLPAKSSKLPARKKSSSVSITGEISEVEEEEEEAKRSRKERKAKSGSGK